MQRDQLGAHEPYIRDDKTHYFSAKTGEISDIVIRNDIQIFGSVTRFTAYILHNIYFYLRVNIVGYRKSWQHFMAADNV